jgi:hypothetical protein
MDEGALSGLAAMASIEKLLSWFGVKWRVAGFWLDMFHSSNLDFQGIGVHRADKAWGWQGV